MLSLKTVVLLSTFATAATASVAPGHLPIINDDYGRARAEAARRQVPLFVEVWAPG